VRLKTGRAPIYRDQFKLEIRKQQSWQNFKMAINQYPCFIEFKSFNQLQMKRIKKYFLSVLFIGSIASLLSFQLPEGWIKAGDSPKKYEMDLLKKAGQNKSDAFTIKSIEESIKGFGTLMQYTQPGKFSEKRVRLSAYIKSENVSQWAGLWFRVDGKGEGKILAFDNMENRAIEGTTGWTKYDIVLDVPQEATGIAYGVLLLGTGQVWFETPSMEIVDRNVKTTGFDMDEE
jgi:hypothetical protein